jgi:hypothetical protein
MQIPSSTKELEQISEIRKEEYVKYCPMMSRFNNRENYLEKIDCSKDCGWFDGIRDCCVMLTTGKKITDIMWLLVQGRKND